MTSAEAANGATVRNGGDGAHAPSVAALRVSEEHAERWREKRAGDLAAVLDALALPAPAFLGAMPEPGASAAELAPADTLLGTDLWPDAAAVAALLGRLRAFLSAPAAVRLFAQAEATPAPFYRAPRLGFRRGVTADDLASSGAGRGASAWRPKGTPNPPQGHAAYRCTLTGAAFFLPLGAPVPVLYFDTEGTEWSGPFDLAARSPLNAAEYVEGDLTDGPSCYDLHPALIEAGPAHVLWAAWHHVERRLFECVEELVDVCDLAAAFAGVEPDALAVEWPARAFRRWTPVERPGEERTWQRRLAGFAVPADAK